MKIKNNELLRDLFLSLLTMILCLSPALGSEETSKSKDPEAVFCEQKIPFKIYEQDYILSASTQGKGAPGLGKSWYKEDENFIYYHGEQINYPANTTGHLIEGGPETAQWATCSKKSGLCQVNSLIRVITDGRAGHECWKSTKSIHDPQLQLYQLQKVYMREVTKDQNTIGGLSCFQLVSPHVFKRADAWVKWEEKEDCVNRDFCDFLSREIVIQSVQGNGRYQLQSVNVTKDFSDSIFTPPADCKEITWRS